MKQPWLESALYDGLWILSPPLLATIGMAILWVFNPTLFAQPMSPWAWLGLVLAIDVSHVYASLYRTVLKKEMWVEKAWLFTFVPLLVYVLGYFLYRADPLWFWRGLAYLAVFHFVRQPYGLVMLYKRGSRNEPWVWHKLDQLAIYTASLYPIACWHLDPSRSFHWFVEGDFLQLDAARWQWVLHLAAALIFMSYAGKELWCYRRLGYTNVPKNPVILGTLVSFGFGILYWNSDLAFTATNVIGHGVAYLGLVWLTDGRRFYRENFSLRLAAVFPLIFVGVLLILAFLEEGFWDLLVWGDHDVVFGPVREFIQSMGLALEPAKAPAILAFLVPLLALPQAVHYVWDGFIWRRP